jgi:hypothetical protein
VFSAGCFYILHLIAEGPGRPEEEVYGTHGVRKPPLVSDLASVPDKGGKDV